MTSSSDCTAFNVSFFYHSEPQGSSRGPMSGFFFVVVFLGSVDAETFLVKNPEVSSDLQLQHRRG